ncbi:MAG: GTPase Era [Proteobacteria bacterium]|nr:GTPase Era [Pseudomonadota bacterium]NDC24379.1 GTPase Era [Pseudomonadota bacterium]NDD05050.1 GTPase Era [Pseudomonadota bacterium]NDG26170.1 GTPase Era [Pseudomonadota bacterium]
MSETKKKNISGFIGIVGPTNSGKSTLLNALVGRKISIVSSKVQTTYRGVSGILNSGDGQFVFTDTPGYQRHPERVAQLLNLVADQKASGCDAVLWVFDASSIRVFDQILKLKEKIKNLKRQDLSFCVLNKVDKIDKLKLLPLIQSVWELGLFKEVVPVSAKKSSGVDRLVNILNPVLPEGEKFYPEDSISDRNTDFHLSEFIREKIYQATHQEVPYSSWIEIQRWATTATEQPKSKVETIHATIHVDSDSRKGILIGKKGEMLKKIGTEARKDIEMFLGKHICLKLHVDVQPKWKEDARFLNRYLELE